MSAQWFLEWITPNLQMYVNPSPLHSHTPSLLTPSPSLPPSSLSHALLTFAPSSLTLSPHPSPHLHSSLCKCSINGHPVSACLFAVVDCGTLVDPDNGMVDITEGTILGNTALYTCFEGFRLVGQESRTCAMSGRWTGSEPICERKGISLKLAGGHARFKHPNFACRYPVSSTGKPSQWPSGSDQWEESWLQGKLLM